MAIDELARVWLVLLWGLVATGAMTTIMEGSQRWGWSKLSLPFLFGTLVTGNRHRAYLFGFGLYLVGGLAFCLIYDLVFQSLGGGSWWSGALLGLAHGIFLLAVFLPLLPHIHPRVASEYDGPTGKRRIEPPGFAGLNYGVRTPAITLIGQLVYGLVLGACLPPPA